MQLSCFYLLSTLYVAHVILDTRPSRFSREYVEKSWVGPGDEATLFCPDKNRYLPSSKGHFPCVTHTSHIIGLSGLCHPEPESRWESDVAKCGPAFTTCWTIYATYGCDWATTYKHCLEYNVWQYVDRFRAQCKYAIQWDRSDSPYGGWDDPYQDVSTSQWLCVLIQWTSRLISPMEMLLTKESY